MAFLRAVLVLLMLLPGAALAQTADDPARAETVSWIVQPITIAKKAGPVKLTLSGTVLPGWHVYSLKQALEGPTPLVVTVDANDIAAPAGAVSESPATTFRDPAFGVDTHFYSNAFTLAVPVRLKSRPGSGQGIPLSVRFQTCNGRICQPPKTVHLSAAVNLAGG